MLPTIVVTRGLVPTSLLNAVEAFLAGPQPLLAVERGFSGGDPILARAATFRLSVRRPRDGPGATNRSAVPNDAVCRCGEAVMSRRKPELQALDIGSWPSVAWTDLDTKAREVTGCGCRPSSALHKVSRSRRSRNRRASIVGSSIVGSKSGLSPHPDGRIFGFRGLLAHVRVAEYSRLSPITLRSERGSCGAAGAFSHLLDRYPTLSAWLRSGQTAPSISRASSHRWTLAYPAARPADVARRVSVAVLLHRADGSELPVQHIAVESAHSSAHLKAELLRASARLPERPAHHI